MVEPERQSRGRWLRSSALGVLGKLYGTMREGCRASMGFWSGFGPSLHCSRRLIHCRLPHPAANRLLPHPTLLCPLLRPSRSLPPSVVSVIRDHLAWNSRPLGAVLLCLIAWNRPRSMPIQSASEFIVSSYWKIRRRIFFYCIHILHYNIFIFVFYFQFKSQYTLNTGSFGVNN